ncbi:hypothetical protein [Nocardioides sp. B-3]|uniref:hypothetical protein n=1 Tax=Nocardioides sp. B-3 TaxID=2895565 RepID=UPI0021537F54|nr:hypothetical protein [Nocardioides sp. B-3]UUZ61183.1 hypothetical protein LP418_11525 [Nocardioides sp. B-3]
MLLIPKFTTVGEHAFPGRRHPRRLLRARRRLDPRRPGEDRQACLRRQLRHGRARAQGAQGVAGRGPVCGTGSRRGQGRIELGRQSADPPSPYGRKDRRHPHLRPADAAKGRARPRRVRPRGPAAALGRPQPLGRRDTDRALGRAAAARRTPRRTGADRGRTGRGARHRARQAAARRPAQGR